MSFIFKNIGAQFYLTQQKLEDVIVCRAGMKGRPYSAYIYRIQPEGKKIPVYVMMEMPSILYVLFEMNTIGHQNSSKKP